jgi:hypothetical protein
VRSPSCPPVIAATGFFGKLLQPSGENWHGMMGQVWRDRVIILIQAIVVVIHAIASRCSIAESWLPIHI